MKKYYIHDGEKEAGPFSVDELLIKGINKDTPIWHEGLNNWTVAGKIEELSNKLPTLPPPFIKPTQEQSKPNQESKPKSSTKSHLLILLTTILCIVIFIVVLSVPDYPYSSSSAKIDINPPKPVVVTKRADMSNSDIKMRATIYTTIHNQGGSGNVSVIFHLTQDGNNYERIKIISMASNEYEDIEVTFDEVRRLGGEITFSVETYSQ